MNVSKNTYTPRVVNLQHNNILDRLAGLGLVVQLNPLSAARVDVLPLRVMLKISKLRNSFFAPLLTASWVAYLY